MLDTSVVVALLQDDSDALQQAEALQGPLLLSVVSEVELAGGLVGPESERRAAKLAAFLANVAVVDFTSVSANGYARIVRAAGYSRRKLLDRMIAAQAVEHRATLVTLNGDDFRDVPGLDLLEW